MMVQTIFREIAATSVIRLTCGRAASCISQSRNTQQCESSLPNMFFVAIPHVGPFSLRRQNAYF